MQCLLGAYWRRLLVFDQFDIYCALTVVLRSMLEVLVVTLLAF